MMKVIKITLSILVCFILIVLFINFLKVPKLEANWAKDSKILPDITINESIVKVDNIRDWRYGKDEIVSDVYFSDEFNLDEIKNTYLLFNPFGKWEGIGHFFFVFEFEGGKTVSVSIEARREEGEDYKFVKGVMNNYELWYAYGSIEDFLSRRAIYHDEDLYMYPLLISEKYSRALFLDLAQITEKLETEPRFYNTITSNCTNLLADSANRVKEGSVPYHYSRVFVGFADNQLYNLELIPHDDDFSNVYEDARIDQYIREYQGDDLWGYIKESMGL